MTKQLLALRLLREAGERGVTTHEFLQAGCGTRYGGRVQDLREKGHVIETERVREGSWRYVLTFDVERDTDTPASRGPLGTADVRPDAEASGMASAACGVSFGADTAPSVAPTAGAERPADDSDGTPPAASAVTTPPAAPPAPLLFDPPSRFTE